MKHILFILLSFCAVLAYGDTLRVATYNVLYLDGESMTGREDDFLTVLADIDPDLVALQEVEDEEAVDQFLSFVLLPIHDDWASALYNSSSYNDNAFFYRTSKVSFVEQRDIHTTLRDITEYTVHPHNLAAGENVRILSAHLKAGNDSGDRAQRRDEALTLRAELDQLPEGELFMFMGDFNLYTSAEDAYQILLDSEPNLNGQLFDPIDSPGSWHNSITYATIHTQSPRAEYGGMDDRFDFILVSAALMDTSGSHVLPETYTPWGNDGLHFNQSINDGENTAVSEEVADALYFASDHLPVVVDVVFRPATMDARHDEISLASEYSLSVYPNPFNPSTTISFDLPQQAHVSLIAYDLLGRKIEQLFSETISAGSHSLNWDCSSCATGLYIIKLRSGTHRSITKAMLLR
ncbi:endonuclease/exonuclease/phosphatase family protein [bacterium]|nr:endonuclease/exonuclease/phosphatase family protein [bacterium]